MASAIVPSRAKAAARLAMPTTSTPALNPDAVTYVRMTLLFNTLNGPSLSPAPVNYFLRWMRNGRPAKVTAAHPIPPTGHFAKEKMALYARVRRPSRDFISDTEAEPLQTTLVLVVANPPGGGEPTVVASCDFDMGVFLANIVDSSSRSLTATLAFTPDVTADVSISIKAIGENHLRPYVPAEPRRLGMRATTPVAQDADEVVAALEIERLRQQNRSADNFPSSIDSSTGSATLPDAAHPVPTSPTVLPTPIMPITSTAPAKFASSTASAITDVEALQAQILALEEEKEAANRERIDAERKIIRHVAHAKKIKETYTQLAAWYNNLRKEHMELQKKVPLTDEESATIDHPRASSNASASSSTYDADIRKIEDEKNALQSQLEAERTDSRETHSRNSQLLETKARTLVELREQWDAAQNALRQREQEAEEHSTALQKANEMVDELKSQLGEKENAVGEKDTALSAANERIQELEQQASALADAKNNAMEESERKLLTQLGESQNSHQSELERAVQEAKDAAEAKRKEELEQLRLAKEEEIESLRQQVAKEQEEKKEQELARVREGHESALEAERSFSKQKSEESDSAAKELRDVVGDAEGQISALKGKLERTQMEFESRMQQMEREKEAEVSTFRDEIRSLVEQKTDLTQELESATALSDKFAEQVSRNEEDRQSMEAVMQKECDDLRHQVTLLKNENDEIRKSPRHVSATAVPEMPPDIKNRHHEEVAELRSMLRMETEKRKEDASLLENADREHDELRSMVTRLRSERDGALVEVKRMQSEVSKFGGRPPVPGPSRAPQGAQELVEARDKAIRELFRVRKALNKDIRRLKKENEELSTESAAASTDRALNGDGEQVAKLSEELSRTAFERDQAQAELEKVKEDVDRAESEFAALSASNEQSSKDLSAALEAEISSLRVQVEEAQGALTNAQISNDSLTQELQREKMELTKKVEFAETAASDSMKELDQKNVEIDQLTEKVRASVEKVLQSEQDSATLTKERDATHTRCEALEAELGSLKKSLDDVSSSTSSTENMLRLAQKENAERATEVTLLKSELDDVRKAAQDAEASLKDEVSTLHSQVTSASTTAEQNEARANELLAKVAEYKSHLESERSLKERETLDKQKLEDSLEETKQKRLSTSNKLEQEQVLRKKADMKAVDLEGQLSDMERTVGELNDKIVTQASELLRISRQRDDAKSVESSLKAEVTSNEAKCREQGREIQALTETLKSSEMAREILQQEASDAGGKSDKVVEELNILRGELDKARNDLRISNGKLDEEASNARASSEKNASMIKDLQTKLDTLTSERATLQARCDAVGKELHDMRSSHGSTRAELEDVKRRCIELEETLAEKENDVHNSSEKIALLREDVARSRGECGRLEEAHEELQSALAKLQSETSERSVQGDLIKELESEIGSLQDRMRSMHGENEERMATERMAYDREMKKMAELRKDLRGARGLVDSLHVQLETARAEADDLRLESERNNSGGDDSDSVVQDLIHTRLELANAHDDIIRLRNRLKKVSPGNASFEF